MQGESRRLALLGYRVKVFGMVARFRMAWWLGFQLLAVCLVLGRTRVPDTNLSWSGEPRASAIVMLIQFFIPPKTMQGVKCHHKSSKRSRHVCFLRLEECV